MKAITTDTLRKIVDLIADIEDLGAEFSGFNDDLSDEIKAILDSAKSTKKAIKAATHSVSKYVDLDDDDHVESVVDSHRWGDILEKEEKGLKYVGVNSKSPIHEGGDDIFMYDNNLYAAKKGCHIRFAKGRPYEDHNFVMVKGEYLAALEDKFCLDYLENKN